MAEKKTTTKKATTKTTKAKKEEEIISTFELGDKDEITAKDYVEHAYVTYGRDIMLSSYQQGRQFLDKYDGLKISYRHMIQTLLEQPDSTVKTHAILGDNMKKVHFHGDGGAEEIVYKLANDFKCVEIQGNSGSRTMELEMPGSAGRYTEAKLKPVIRDQLKHLMPYVPQELTFTKYYEKRYIPTPIPLGLIAGSSGMGIGYQQRVPAFTAMSMYKAYLKNDPSLLRLNFGYSLGSCYDPRSFYDHKTNTIKGPDISDQEPTENNLANLKKIWEKGEGRLTLGIPVYNTTIGDRNGFLCVCDPALGTPKKSPQIEEWEKEGLIEVMDLSDEVGKLFFALQPRVRKITLEDLRYEIMSHCNIHITNPLTTIYTLNIACDDLTGKVGLYNWIDFTHWNYTQLYEKYRMDQISKLDFEELIWYSFEQIVDLLTDKKNPHEDEEIVKIINDKLSKGTKKDKEHLVTLEVVQAVGEKAYNTYRNANPAKRLGAIAKERQDLKDLVIEDKIKEYVKAWSDLKRDVKE